MAIPGVVDSIIAGDNYRERYMYTEEERRAAQTTWARARAYFYMECFLRPLTQSSTTSFSTSNLWSERRCRRRS